MTPKRSAHGSASLRLRLSGTSSTGPAGTAEVTLEVRAWQFWLKLLQGSRGLADAYAAGLWEAPDLASVIRVAARYTARADGVRRLLVPLRTPGRWLASGLRPRTRRRSRHQIAAHYDLGNQLFTRMLDPTLSYSCAIFERAGMTLEQAQRAKLERVCEKLALSPEDRILEIGTGWGSFALHAASTRGCHVTTTTISREQRDYAVERIRRAGLADRITVLMQDYRDLRGRYDKLVSIEMIEAVGWRHFGTFFARCAELLRQDGAMLLQAITIDDRLFELEKASRSFIRTRIFPGGCLPSRAVIARQLARRTDLRIAGSEDLTPHYIKTLRLWRERFTENERALAELGYDDRFRRLWRLYLAYCEAGFAERRIEDVQLLLVKPHCQLAAGAHGGPALGAPAPVS